MNGFWGAESEAVRRQASASTTAAGTVESLLARCGALVEGVHWVGPDAEAFRERWGSGVRPRLERLTEELRADGEELTRHAEEQDEVSSGDDGGPGPGSGTERPRVPSLPGIPGLPLPFPAPGGWPVTPPAPQVPSLPAILGPVLPPPRFPEFELPHCPSVEISEISVPLGQPTIGVLPEISVLPDPVRCFITPELLMPDPLLLPEPLEMPENWPLPQPLPQPLPIPDLWPLPQPLPRPDVHRI